MTANDNWYWHITHARKPRTQLDASSLLHCRLSRKNMLTSSDRVVLLTVNAALFKFMDNAAITEVIKKRQASQIETTVDEFD